VRLPPLDEVRHDEEVAREPHGLDDADLELEPRPVVRFRRREVDVGEPRLQPLARLPGQLLRFAAARGAGEARQDGIELLHQEGAAARDVERVVAGLGQVLEGLAHGRGRLEPVLGRHAPAVLLAEERAVGDGEQGVVRAEHGALGEIDVVGGDDRDVALVGVFDEARLDRLLRGEAVTLQLDIEAVGEDLLQLLEHGPGLLALARGQQRIHRPVGPAGQEDQALGVVREKVPGHRGLVARGREIGLRRQGHQVAPARFALGQEHDRGRARVAILGTEAQHRQGAADDRLDARVLAGLGELQRPEQVGPVGDGHRRHARGRRQLAELLGLDRALEQRIGRTDPQMDEPFAAHTSLRAKPSNPRRRRSPAGRRRHRKSP
jgi:hypothetical protein